MPKIKQLYICFAVISTVGLSGCALPNKTPPNLPAEKNALETFTTQQKDEVAGATLARETLTPHLLFQILESDLAAQRGLGEKSVQQWVKLAQQIPDARAARQATLVAIKAKDFAAAEEMLSLWIQRAPQSQTARRLMLSVLLQNKKVPQIIPHVEMLLQSDPTTAPNLFVEMPLWWGPGLSLDEVVSTTKTLTQKYLALPEAKFALAYVYQISGQTDKAMALLNTALKQKPTLKVADDFRQAITNNPKLGQVISITLTYPEALVKADVLLQAGDYAAAQQIYTKLRKADPNSIEAAYGEGIVAWQQGEFKLAIKRLVECEVRHPPNVEDIRFTLARIHEQMGDFKSAQQWYQRIQGIRQKEAHQALVICLAKNGQIKEALKRLQRIPQHTKAQKIQYAQLQGQIYFVNKAFDKGIAILSQAIKAYPDTPDFYYDRAMGFEQMDQLAQAEADLRHALSISPNDPMILNSLGFILTEHNMKLNEAEALLRQARELVPNNFYIEDSWGWLLYRQGKFAEAEKVLAQVLRVHKDPELIAHLGEVLWAQKKWQEAKALLDFGMKLYPGNKILHQTIARLGLL